MEDDLLTLYYQSRGGGRPSHAARDHLRQAADAILLAHMPGDGQTSFTCDKRVTVDNVGGMVTSLDGFLPASTSVIAGLPYEGVETDIPMKALTFLVNRYLYFPTYRCAVLKLLGIRRG